MGTDIVTVLRIDLDVGLLIGYDFPPSFFFHTRGIADVGSVF